MIFIYVCCRMTVKVLDERELCILECLVLARSSSYMTKAQYFSCLDTLEPSDGRAFPIPKVCAVTAPLEIGTVLTLKYVTGVTVATLQVAECWQPDLKREWIAVLGSDDPNHPYIQYQTSKGSYYISGKLRIDPTYKLYSAFTATRTLPSRGFWRESRNPLQLLRNELLKITAFLNSWP